MPLDRPLITASKNNIDYADYELDPQKEASKEEITFEASPFKTTATYKDLSALAFKLQDLLLMESGTNPAAVDMGVGIRNYLQEPQDDITLEGLNRLIQYQQQTYLPTPLVKSLQFRRDPNILNKIYLFVQINNDNDEYIRDFFAIGLSSDGQRQTKTLSEVLI